MKVLGFRAYIKPLKRYATGLDTIQFHKCCDVAGAGIWTVVTLNEGIFEGDDIVLEQYTGLKDKNGKDIYEGDIVTVKDNDIPFSLVNTISTEKWLVRFNMHRASFTLVKSTTKRNFIRTFQHIKQEDIEVIGNIHENKELWR